MAQDFHIVVLRETVTEEGCVKRFRPILPWLSLGSSMKLFRNSWFCGTVNFGTRN